MLRSTPRLSNPGASPLHILNRLFHVAVYVVQLQSRGDSLLHPCRSPYHQPHIELAHFRVTRTTSRHAVGRGPTLRCDSITHEPSRIAHRSQHDKSQLSDQGAMHVLRDRHPHAETSHPVLLRAYL